MGFTPTGAGDTRELIVQAPFLATHPRLRGEYDIGLNCVSVGQDSPPLTRGILVSSKGCPAEYRLTPACAGNMVTLIPLSLPIVTHPHLRGEDIPKLGDTWQYADSPPLTRGILFLCRSDSSRCVILRPTLARNVFPRRPVCAIVRILLSLGH